MSAPNRASEVAAVVDIYKAQIFGSDDTRREGLKIIATELNKLDGNQWGRLWKPEKQLIMADILVWHDTGEHFDVLTDSAATWIPRGIIQAGWDWSAVTDVPIPIPEPPPASDDLKKILDALGAWSQALGILTREIDTALLEHAQSVQRMNDFQAAVILQIDQLRVAALSLKAPVYDTKIFGVKVVLTPRPPAPENG